MLSFGFILALLGTFFWALSAFPFTSASRVMGVGAMNLFRMVAGTIMVGITALLLESENMLGIFHYHKAWLWLGASGIISLAIGDYFSYKMYAILSPRLGSIFTTFSPATALIFGIYLLNEHLNFIGIAGMIITIVGVMGMSLSRSERGRVPDHGHGSIFTGIVAGVFGALCHGAGLALSKKGFLEQGTTEMIGPVSGSFIRFASGTVVVLLALTISGRIKTLTGIIFNQKLKTIGTAFSGVIFGPVLAVSFAMSAIQYIDVAVAQTVFALVPVGALIISSIVYKEKITLRGIVGLVTAVAGVAVLIWRDVISSMLSS